MVGRGEEGERGRRIGIGREGNWEGGRGIRREGGRGRGREGGEIGKERDRSGKRRGKGDDVANIIQVPPPLPPQLKVRNVVTTKQEKLLGERDETIASLRQEVESLKKNLAQREEEVREHSWSGDWGA